MFIDLVYHHGIYCDKTEKVKQAYLSFTLSIYLNNYNNIVNFTSMTTKCRCRVRDIHTKIKCFILFLLQCYSNNKSK